MPTEPKRKLAAIMFTDMVGYTTLMQKDESKARELIQRHRSLMKPLIEKHSGKVLQYVGDGTFITFESAIEAVNCGFEIQYVLKVEKEMTIRIGVHIGDVVLDGDEVYGDGVNVASRLEPLAEPGGICVSQEVYRLVKSHPEISARSLGKAELKNVEDDMEVYALSKIPQFYAEDLAETSVSVRKGEKQLFDFKINSIKRMPPPERSFRSVLLIIIGLFFAYNILGFVWGFMASPIKLRSGEFQDPAGFIAKLRDTDNSISQYIKGMLLAETVQLIGEYEELSSVSYALEKVLQKDLSRILTRGKLLFDEQSLEHLDLSEELSAMIKKNLTGNDLAHLNRLLLGRAFPNEITERPIPIFIALLEAVKVLVYKEQEIQLLIIVLFGIVVLLAIVVAYFIAFASVQVRFSDVRHADEMLEYFVVQMGFKPPTKDRENLVFKPTLSKFIKEIFVGFPTKIRARIEGNSVVITSTIPTVRRLTKQLNAFSN